MKSIFRIVALVSLLFCCLYLHATATVSGTIKDPSGAVVPNSFVRFELANTNNNQCSAAGVTLGKRLVDFTANTTTGAISGTLYRTDTEISCGGFFTSRYNMTIYRKGVPDGPSKCVIVNSDFNIASPIYCTAQTGAPALPAPNFVQNNPVTSQVVVQSAGTTFTVQGDMTANTLNGTPHCETYAGADASAKINACMADAASGIADATGFTGAQTFGSVINIPDGVTLKLNPLLTYTVTVTGGVDAITVGANGLLDCGTMTNAAAGKIVLGASANVKSLLAPFKTDGTQEFFNYRGCVLQGNATATVTDSLAREQGVFVNSRVSDNQIQYCYNTTCLHIVPGTSTAIVSYISHFNNWLNCGGIANCKPLVIEGVPAGNISGIYFYGGAIEHATGNPLITIDGKGPAGVCSNVRFFGVGFETSSALTDAIKVTDCQNVTIDNLYVSGPAGTNIVTLAETFGGSTTGVDIGAMVAGVWTKIVNDTITSDHLTSAISKYCYKCNIKQAGVSSLTLGSSSTALSRYAKIAATLSPVLVAANTCAAQTLTVTGVQASDIILRTVKPTEQAGLGAPDSRVTGANTVSMIFCNTTGVGITPTASESYTFIAVQ